MKKTLIAGLATLALGLGLSFGAPITSAQAGSLNLYVTGNGVYIGGHKQRNYNGHRSQRRHAVCEPGRAVYKAERRGIRHARIDRVNPRFVVVKGRMYGDRITAGFYRDSRRCELAWVKESRSHRKHHGRYGGSRR
ncbi:MAG: hypothetical protein WBC71_03675 [Salaquimonas sp.]